MASLLRQIVASPRSRHPEAGLDLCYVTDRIIATSGPSDTYPKRAYRNPLDDLVKFLDKKHGANWAIWEFRAEGTGYPDSMVYDRIWHYPFPDHHPPPFALIPNIMASMRNWMKESEDRVVVVHCKAGKGRSGTAACSYMISEQEWTLDDAIKRFTERRMRPNFGPGISIPSQMRWLRYVDGWTRHGKLYVERQVEIVEVHVWGLRGGVKVAIEGFIDEGRTIKMFHTFHHKERELVRGVHPPDTGLADVVGELMRRKKKADPIKPGTIDLGKGDVKTVSGDGAATPTDSPSDSDAPGVGDDADESTCDVVFRPKEKVVLPTNDINIDIERRNMAAYYGWTMVNSVAHIWFNTFFEGNGPEKDGHADDSGVFETEWAPMDGVKGSSRKGMKAFDKLAVVWRVVPQEDGGELGKVVTQPAEGEPVKQTQPADWRGVNEPTPGTGKDIGLRPMSDSEDEGKASQQNIQGKEDPPANKTKES